MKLRLMICAMVASAALFATDATTSDIVYGVMAVEDTESSTTVVGVPWVNTGAGDVAPITLSNLVSTATLANGDIIYLYEGTSWYGYRLNDGIWEPYTTVGGSGQTQVSVSTPDSADAKSLVRGTGFIVQRASKTDPIYLCGRYDSSAPSATTIGAGATVLIANPGTATKNITTGSTGDQIRVPLDGGAMNIYEKRSDGWYETVTDTSFGFPITEKKLIATGVPLAPGKGAWYVSKDEGSTITW